MIHTSVRKTIVHPWQPVFNFGTRGYLLLFGWLVGLAMFLPGQRLWPVVLLSLGIAALTYPAAIRRLLHWRWLVFFGFLLIPNLLWGGPGDAEWLGVSVSLAGLQKGWAMVMRSFIIILAVDGLAASVSISEMAGLFERIGLQGLGFALGIAVNLLPTLRQTAMQTWHSLWLRGGFKRQRLQAMRFFLITVVVSTLRRAMEIGLAAEARAFSPERARPLPLKTGRADPILAGLLLVITLLIAASMSLS